MSDYSVNAELPKAKRTPKAEFVVYFGLIFVLAMLLHVPRWIYQAIRHARLPRLGPVARAMKDAQAVTPMIFGG
jgi:hypothetical protein